MRETSTNMKRIVVLSGAGISAESGLQTFRGADGLEIVACGAELLGTAVLRVDRPCVGDFVRVGLPDLVCQKRGNGDRLAI